jgi:hypothetical protein
MGTLERRYYIRPQSQVPVIWIPDISTGMSTVLGARAISCQQRQTEKLCGIGIADRHFIESTLCQYISIVYTVYNVVDQFDIRSISFMAIEYAMCGYCRFQCTLQRASNHALDGVLPAEYVSYEASR